MKAPRFRAKPRTIGYMRYLSKMKDLGPRRMSQDQRPRTQRSGFKTKIKSTNQNSRNKGEELKTKTHTKIRKAKDE